MNVEIRKPIVVRILLIALVASWAGGMGCTSREESIVEKPSASAESAKPEPMDSQERAKELAKLTAQAYREATHLSYKVWIEHGKPVERLWCVVEQGRQHRCHLRVYTEEEGLYYELRCVPDPVGVRIREDNYRGGESEEYVVTPADYRVDKWDIRCQKGINGCSFGGQLWSWLGPESYKPDFLEEIISGGEYVDTVRVDGRPCDVIETHRVKGLEESIYLDRDSHIVRLWLRNHNGIVSNLVFCDVGLVHDETSEAAGTTRPGPLDKRGRAKELAKLTAEAYRKAQKLSYDVNISLGVPPEKIHCSTVHGRDYEHFLQVYDEQEQLFYELRFSRAPGGVRMQENNYRSNESQDRVLSFVDFVLTARSVQCRKGINGCSFGGQLRSWVGPDSEKAAFLEEILSDGEYVGTGKVNGHLCDIVETHRVKNLIEKVYLDQKSHVVRRWYHNYNGIVRDRVFSKIEISYDVEESAH